MSQIEQLTAPQIEQLQIYRDRWWHRLTSTQTLNRVKAEAAVGHAYEAVGLNVPEVHFFSGPLEFRNYLKSQSLPQRLSEWGAPMIQFPLGKMLADELHEQLSHALWVDLVGRLNAMGLAELSLTMYSAIFGPVVTEFAGTEFAGTQEPMSLNQPFTEDWLAHIADHQWQAQGRFWKEELRRQPGGDWLVSAGESLWDWAQPLNEWVENEVIAPLRADPLIQELEMGMRQIFGFFSLFGLGFEALEVGSTEFYAVLLDYCHEVLGCSLNPSRWGTLRSLYTDCGPILTFEKACFVFERPTTLSFDEEGRMHGEGEPAIAFDDGYGQYCFQGVHLPPKYGAVHPNLWKAAWILTEPNAEFRRILIVGIGYSRICQELDAMVLDVWREYTLLRIDQPIDIEPVFLLKMTCPSTNSIHATRVPPHLSTAREAIRWMNWDIDPEDFRVET